MISFIIWFILGFWAAGSSASCEDGWIHYSDEGYGKCYYVNTTKGTQVESVRRCEEMGAYLACPATKNETEFIKQRLNESGLAETKGNQYWIGLYRETTTGETLRDGWVWLDNTTYEWRNWYPKQPDGGKRCARLLSHQDWMWGGAYCDSKDNYWHFSYICEKNALTTTSEATTATYQTSAKADSSITTSDGNTSKRENDGVTTSEASSKRENDEVTTSEASSASSPPNVGVFIAVGVSAGCLCVLVLVAIVVVIVLKRRRKQHKPAGSGFGEEFEIYDNGYEQVPYDSKTKRGQRKQRQPATPSVPPGSKANLPIDVDYDTVADQLGRSSVEYDDTVADLHGRSSVEYDNPCMVDVNQYADPREFDPKEDKKSNGTRDTSLQATSGDKEEDIASLYAKPMKKKGEKERGKDGPVAGSSTGKLDIEALYAKPDKRKKPGTQEEQH